MPATRNETQQQRLIAVADALAVAASAAKGLSRANLEVDLGHKIGLGFKKLSKLQERRDLAEERFQAAARRVAPALITVGIED